ncbi:ABC transporter permease [Nitrincola tibetensis]|uniref:ABC transporter permease n=1 Tax=Nitrincola tibetensis TaxID=2219697 RepID=A0A364NMP9_9GAMM|nr:ABC transporter permease [Nitrincola tibetensis]RAU18270.1 ABC transporter permease [Nitrincola tibetensis]
MSLVTLRLRPSQWVGAAMILSLLIFALLEAWLHSGHYAKQNLANYLMMPNVQEWLGTDQFGRSMMARMGSAIRLSFLLSFFCVLTSVLLGSFLGVMAGWYGGWIDRVLNWVVNILMALPGLILVLLLAAILPGSFLMLYFAISLVLWLEYYRVVRALTQVAVSSPQMEASRQLGFGRFYLFKRHIWPSLQSSVLTLAAFGAANSILALASLGFIYVGLQPPVAELGLMVVELLPYFDEAPWILMQPLVAIFMLVLGFNLLAGKAK